LHVRDASRAALAILEHGRSGEVYNVSPDDVHRIRDVVAVVCDLLGRDFEAATCEVEDRRGQTSVSRFDSSKIRRELGWAPQVSLREGIAGVLGWLETDWDRFMGEQLVYMHQA
jgi:dTDP-glucose 4,6-dehydratase